ncbi:MAG: guanylate kinase [Gammaproteobacteria bacterium]
MTASTKPRGRLVVISAPSGAGKTSLVRELVHSHPDICFGVSCTTRQKREGEEGGRDYQFISRQEFDRMVVAGEFLEHAQVFDNFYGTPRDQVNTQLDKGKHVILEIDWQGARQVRGAEPSCVSIFIMPPSRSELENRLRQRATDSDDVIARRLQDAVNEMSHWEEFDYLVVNDNFGEALQEVLAIIRGGGERSRSNRAEIRPLITGLLARDS